MLHVKNRRQVALFKTYGIKEVVGLRTCRRLIAPEVIGTTYESVFACLTEIVLEFVVNASRAFCRFYHYKAQWTTLDAGSAQLVPVDVALVVRNVNTVYFVACRIVGIAEQCTPSESGRTYQKRVEQPHVQTHYGNAANPPCCMRIACKQGAECRLLLCGRSLACSFLSFVCFACVILFTHSL